MIKWKVNIKSFENEKEWKEYLSTLLDVKKRFDLNKKLMNGDSCLLDEWHLNELERI